MEAPYTYQLKHDQNGRIIEKTETVAGETITWKFSYDKEGRLSEARLDGRLICQCDYDREGRRSRDYFPATVGPHYRNYQYTTDNRLLHAGNNTYTHDDSGFRNIWSSGGTFSLYEYSPDYRLLKMEVENQNRMYTYSHDEDGQRAAKHCNDQLVEAYQWLDFVRIAGFHDGEHAYEFAYHEGGRTPFAMRRDDGAIAGLFYDQVGSLRAVADLDNNVIKEILYDPFGGIIEDTNPGLRIPIGFAGGLHDRDLGFVRFGWRDYDTYTGRWTAPDPIGDRGGDLDWYGYCLDDPVNAVDINGLASALALPFPMPPVAPVFIPGTEENNQFVNGTIKGIKGLWGSISESHTEESSGNLFYGEHKKKGSTNPSNLPKHQKGKKRKRQDKHGGEKGDARRPYRRK